MNYLGELGTMERTKYRNSPAMLATSEAVTQEVSALMLNHSIPNSTTESNSDWRLSVPRQFLDRVGLEPPVSFGLLPVIKRRFDYDKWDHSFPLAPALFIPRCEDGQFRFTVDIFVVRCPLCGDHHVHQGATIAGSDTPDGAIEQACMASGARRSKCTKFTPLNRARPDKPNSTLYSSARYYTVPIDHIPNTAELNHYFPMTDDFIVHEDRKQSPGYVYLLESNGFYKIGISSNPQKRIQSLQTASPVPIETIHIEQSDRYQQLESELHTLYAVYRTQGEWFAFPDPMIGEVIAAMKGGAR